MLRNGIIWLIILVLIVSLYGFGCRGGSGNTPDAQDARLLASERYFPTEPGVEYTYRPVTILDPLDIFTKDVVYVTEESPLGEGIYFRNGNQWDSGPVFDGLEFLGTARADRPAVEVAWCRVPLSGGPTSILPDELTGVGQQWLNDLTVGTSDLGGNSYTEYTASFEVAAVENVRVGPLTHQDCLRLDVLVKDYRSWPNPLEISGSIWFAPDIGPVLITADYEGLEVARIELVSRKHMD